VTSSGDEDGGEEKRKRTYAVEEQSVSPPGSDDSTPKRADVADDHKRSPVTSLSGPEVNGEGGYLSCSTQDSTKEHPLVSLEKFVGVSAPLFRSSAAPPAVASNGISSPVRRLTPGIPDGKTAVASDDDDDDTAKMTSYGSMRGADVTTSGSLGRGFAPAQSLLCCNL